MKSKASILLCHMKVTVFRNKTLLFGDPYNKTTINTLLIKALINVTTAFVLAGIQLGGGIHCYLPKMEKVALIFENKGPDCVHLHQKFDPKTWD